MENIKYGIEQIDIMQLKEALYYSIVAIISLGIMYVIVFKTSLVATSNGLMAGLSVIILLILKQLYGWVKSQNGN